MKFSEWCQQYEANRPVNWDNLADIATNTAFTFTTKHLAGLAERYREQVRAFILEELNRNGNSNNLESLTKEAIRMWIGLVDKSTNA